MDAEASRPPRRDRLRHRILLSACVPVLLLLGLEVGCRLFGVRPIAVQRPFLDFNLGWVFVTGEDPSYFVRHPTRFFQPRPDARGVARTDRHGFRGPEHPAAHENLLRVAVLGDSTTFGFGVRYGDSYVARLAAALRARCRGTDVDVVNAGCYAYSSYQNLVDLEERVLPLAPDVVVLGLSGFNDGVGAVGFEDEVWGAYSPRGAGPVAAVLERSRFAALLRRALEPLQTELLIGDPEQAQREVLEGAKPKGRRVPLDRFERNVRAMVERARDAGAACVLMVHEHPESERAIDPERFRYTETVRRLAAELELPLCDGAARLPPADAHLYYDKIHPTEEGHRLLAEGLIETLVEVPAVRERCRPASASLPALRAVRPSTAYATGGAEIAIEGAGFAALRSPRVLVAGEPAELLGVEDETLRVVMPPAAPGDAAVELLSERGSVRLDGALRVRGPELSVREQVGAAIVRIEARPGERYRLFCATELEPRPIMLGRVHHLKGGTMWSTPLEGAIPEGGVEELRVPLPAGPRPALHLQAFLEPPEGEYPRVLLTTGLATLPGRGADGD